MNTKEEFARGADESVDRLPVIDFGPFIGGSAAGKRAVAHSIREANESAGFFYLTNFGVDPAIMAMALRAAKSFFELPETDKQSVAISPQHRGYIGLRSTQREGSAPELLEAFTVGRPDLDHQHPDVLRNLPLHGPNQWPQALPQMQPAIEEYFVESLNLGRSLVKAFALALDLEEDHFDEMFASPMASLRLLHYPPQQPLSPEDQYGISPHTDTGCFTLLAVDEIAGLQVLKRNGDWIEVPQIPDALVINIGDMLMRWTNDRWRSTLHRVINTSGRERFSMPLFIGPSYDTEVSCIETCVPSGELPKYTPVKYGEYIVERFNNVYAYRKD